MHADDAAGVLAVGAGLAAEAGRPAGVAARAGRQVEHLAGVHAGQRHLGGADEVQVVALDPVDLLVVLAEEAGALHRLGAHQRRRDDGDEAGGHGPADRQLGERELQQRARAGEEVEARAGDLRAALDVDRAERLADLEVVADREVVGGHLADGAQLHRVVLTAGRDAVVRRRWDLQVRLAQGGVGGALGLLGLLDLGGERLGPLEHRGALLGGRPPDRLRGGLLLAAQVVGALDRLAAGGVGGQQGVDQGLVGPAGALAGTDGVGVLAHESQVDHPPIVGGGPRGPPGDPGTQPGASGPGGNVPMGGVTTVHVQDRRDPGALPALREALRSVRPADQAAAAEQLGPARRRHSRPASSRARAPTRTARRRPPGAADRARPDRLDPLARPLSQVLAQVRLDPELRCAAATASAASATRGPAPRSPPGSPPPAPGAPAPAPGRCCRLGAEGREWLGVLAAGSGGAAAAARTALHDRRATDHLRRDRRSRTS